MPPVLVGAALLYGGAIKLGAFLLTTISYGISKYQESRLRRRMRRDANAALQDRLVMQATVDRARSRCYGRVRNADGILFKATYGPKKEQYCLVIALAGHEIDGVEQVYFGDVPVTLGAGGLVETAPWNGQTYDTAAASIPAGSTSVTLSEAPRSGSVQMVAETPDGDVIVTPGVAGAVVSNASHSGFLRRIAYQLTANKHKARVTFWNGSPEQDLSASLAVEFPGLISPGDHRFAGIACLRVDMVYSQDAFPNGIPQISAVFRAARVLDPRLNRAPNPDYLGAAVGGSLGTGLGMTVTGSGGLAMSVVGVGAEDGQAYADVRIVGAAVGSPAYAEISFATAGSRPAAAAGQLWLAGLHARHVAGAAPSVPNLVITERDEAGAVLQSTATGVFISGPTGLSRARRTVSRTLTQAGTTRVGCHLLYLVNAGQSIDVTVRVGLATLSQTVDAIRWTENPGLISRDWSLYANGGGCGPDDLHGDTFTTAANASDVTHSFESVNQSGATVTTVRPMFTAGIVCDTSLNPLDTLAEICESMAGAYAWTGGRLRVKAGAYSAPVATITADWLSDKGSISMVKDAPVTSLVNVITPTIADAAKKYIAAPLPRIAPAVYIEADGQEHPREDVYLAVTDADHAGHVAGVALRDSRAARTYRLPCNLLALATDVFDTVALDIPEIGATGEAFEVQGTELDFAKGLVWLNLKATAASIFDPDAEFRREDALINNSQPNPFVVPALALLPPESGTAHLLRQADGTIISRLCVKWTAVDDEAVINGGAIEIRCGRPGTDPALWQTYSAPGGDTQLYIDAVQDGAAYAVIGRCRNKLVAGAWTVPKVHVIVGKTAAPALVAGLTAVVVPGALRVSRTPSTEVDWAGTIYRYGASFGTGTTVPGSSDRSGIVWPWPPLGTFTIWAADFDSSGNIGPAASYTVTIGVELLIGAGNTLAGGGPALNANPACNDPSAWGLDSGLVFAAGVTGSGVIGTHALSLPAGSSLDRLAFTAETIPISALRRYALTANLSVGSGNDRNMYLVVRMYRADGSDVGGTGWGGTYSGYTFGGLVPPGGWHVRGADFGTGTARPIPADVAYCRIGVWFRYSTGSSTAGQLAQDVRLREILGTGEIQTDNIAGEAATALRSASGTLTNLLANPTTTFTLVSLSYTAVADCTVAVRVGGYIKHFGGFGHPSGISAAFAAYGCITTSSSTVPGTSDTLLSENRNSSDPASVNAIAMEKRYAMTAGQTLTFYAIGYVGSISNVSGAGGSYVPGAVCEVSVPTMLIEAVKR